MKTLSLTLLAVLISTGCTSLPRGERGMITTVTVHNPLINSDRKHNNTNPGILLYSPTDKHGIGGMAGVYRNSRVETSYSVPFGMYKNLGTFKGINVKGIAGASVYTHSSEHDTSVVEFAGVILSKGPISVLATPMQISLGINF